MELHADESLEEEIQGSLPQPKKPSLVKKQTGRKKAGAKEKDEQNEIFTEYEYVVGAIRRAAARVKSADFEKDSAEVRAAQIKKHWEKLIKLHALMTNKAEAKRKTELNTILTEIEEEYLFAMGEFETKIQQRKGESSVAQQVVQVQASFRESEVRNTWGEFDGTIKKWPGFRDRFVAAVHNNNNISPAYKFQHLSQSMVGKAARTLGEWQLTADNYQLAWERLLQIYDNKNVICKELLRSFFKLPILTGPPRANDLQRMSNVTHETMRQLKAQGVPVEHWDVIVVHILQERLDTETGRQWELQRTSEFSTTAQMLTFLDYQAAAIATTTVAGRERCERPARTMASVVVRPTAAPGSEREAKRMPCPFCHSMFHPIWDCPSFQELNITTRKDVAMRNNLCLNCFNILGGKKTALLPTALIRLHLGSECIGPFRALIDSGSQLNFVSASVLHLLKGCARQKKTNIMGIDGEVLVVKQTPTLAIKPWFQSDFSLQEDFWVMPREKSWRPIMPTTLVKEIDDRDSEPLADPHYGSPGEVHALLGVNIIAKIVHSVLPNDKDGTIEY